MQEFYIKQGSTLPTLRLELIYDGRSDFNKIWDAIQDSEITFTMTNIDNNIIKIANEEAYIQLKENNSCIEEYVICYDWKKRDTNTPGVYKGEFKIHFNGNIVNENQMIKYPSGDLIVPIREDLMIIIK